jgi:hypothetical protein
MLVLHCAPKAAASDVCLIRNKLAVDFPMGQVNWRERKKWHAPLIEA